MRRFEFQDGSSHKFWQIDLEGSSFTVTYGKIGAAGQTQTKTFPNELKAQAEHDKLVREKLGKGYVEAEAESSPREQQKEVPQALPESKRAEGLALPARTFDQFRDYTFALVAKYKQRYRDITDSIVQWSQHAPDAQVMGWLERLAEPNEGWLSYGAACVAVQRAIEGNLDSARRFVEAAESALPPEKEKDDVSLAGSFVMATPHLNALRGLIPAWWRLGKKAEADSAFAKMREKIGDPNKADNVDFLAGIAAMGGRKDLVTRMAPQVFQGSGKALLFPGLAALRADGALDAVEAVMARWAELRFVADDLTFPALAQAVRVDKPGDYLDLFTRFPFAFYMGERCAERAFLELERVDPAEAVRMAKRALAQKLDFDIHVRALSILATHAPEEATAWEKENQALIADKKTVLPFFYLAALGRNDQASEGVKVIAQSSDRDIVYGLVDLARIVTDRSVAVLALKALVKNRRLRFEDSGDALVYLVDLGERACVDDYLAKQLAKVQKMAPKGSRDSCAELARVAGMVGRIDVARIAIGLQSGDELRAVSGACVAGCASVGDWAGAMAALELVPDEKFDFDSRLDLAVNKGFATADRAWVNGPRALPLRAIAR